MATKEISQTSTSKNEDNNHKGVGRRTALTVLVAAGAAGVAVVAGPKIVSDVEQGASNLAHQALTHELDSLETVSLDDAIRAAEITKAAVQVIVLPLANLAAVVGGDALGILLASLNTATNVLNSVHIDVAALSALRNTVASWHKNIASMPIGLTSYLTSDINSAEIYLKTLKKSIQSS